MKTKISDIQKVVYNPPTPVGPQPPQPPQPKNPKIKPISDEPEEPTKPQNGQDGDEGDENENKPSEPNGPEPKGDEPDGDDSEPKGDEPDGDGPTGPDGKSKPDDGTDGELSEEERKEIWEKLNEKQKQTDTHIEDPNDIPDTIVDIGGEGGDKFQPNKPDEATPEQTENIRRQAKEITERAEKAKSQAGGVGGSGFTSAGLDREVKVTTNWKQELRRFLQPAAKKRSTYSRLDKRLVGHGIAMPTRRTLPFPKLDVVVGVDTSYSITKPVFRTFISEIISIVNSFDEIKLKLLLFHTDVYALIDIDTTEKGKKTFKKIKGIQQLEVNTKQEANNILTKVTLYQGGGTDISSIYNFLKTNLNIDSLEGLLVFTDGDNNSPNIKLPKTKNLLFLINSGGNTRIVSKYGPYKIVDVEHS